MTKMFFTGQGDLAYDLCAVILAALMLLVHAGRREGQWRRAAEMLVTMEGGILLSALADGLSLLLRVRGLPMASPLLAAADLVHHLGMLGVSWGYFRCILTMTGLWEQPSRARRLFFALPAAVLAGVSAAADLSRLTAGDSLWLLVPDLLLPVSASLYFWILLTVIIFRRREISRSVPLLLAMNGICALAGLGCILLPQLRIYHFLMMALMLLVETTLSSEQTRALRRAGEIDELTGLGNRRALRQAMPRLVDRQVCAAMVDIDNFKQFNDSAGHQCGDEVIARCGDRIRRLFGGEGFRYGGDEFLILSDLPQEEFERRVEELSQSIARMSVSGTRQTPGVSIGTAEGRAQNLKELIELIDEADRRMYRRKDAVHRRQRALPVPSFGQGRQRPAGVQTQG